jgi:hypothetical protein
MAIEQQPVEFEAIFASLKGLTQRQVIDLVWHHASTTDAQAFAVLVEGLSADAVRFLAARALLRLQIFRVA